MEPRIRRMGYIQHTKRAIEVYATIVEELFSLNTTFKIPVPTKINSTSTCENEVIDEHQD